VVAIGTLVVITLLVATVVHWRIARYFVASIVAASIALVLTKVVQLAYFGYLHPLWILSLPGEFLLALVVALFVGVLFAPWERNRS
jgi:hypothetical protein